MQHVNNSCDLDIQNYPSLYGFSLEQPEKFWRLFWQFADIIATGSIERVLLNRDRMPGATWFPDVSLNYAENLLRRRDEGIAIVFRGEDQVYRSLSYAALYAEVAATAAGLRARGVVQGDRVAGFLPNMPEAIVAMLATVSIGAVWSSSSPDFGANGVVDRFGQIEPRVLFCADGYHYNGKQHDSLLTVAEVCDRVPSIEQVVVIPYLCDEPDIGVLPSGALLYGQFMDRSATDIEFVRLPFDHPLYILYSSGTTGVPKCIVHTAGGILIQHMKEHLLHVDVKPDDRLFYFTTCGWMMWNWLVSGLACNATLMLYDGSPFYPNGNVLFDYIDSDDITLFGTSAKFLDAAAKASIEPAVTHNLTHVRTIMSTGSTLAPEGFDYVYQRIKSDVCLSSMSGGTDICGCFVGGSPVLPVYRGQLQCSLLGMANSVFDEQGNPLDTEKGELVCTQPFPSMPAGFWNDPDGSRYHSAYFDRFENVWCHGDYVAMTPEGGMVIYGRSDAVLNPGGVRIGTAEIYRQVEQLPEVIESLVIGQDFQNDVRVVLFVRLAAGIDLDDALVARIRAQIRSNTTPRHVPAIVLSVADIPRTRSGKIVELAVRDVVHGRAVRNREALANPEALDQFADLEALRL